MSWSNSTFSPLLQPVFHFQWEKINNAYRHKNKLHSACINGNLKVASLLIRRGAKVNKLDLNGETPLHKACEIGHLKLAKLLVRKGAYVNSVDGMKQTSLHKACMRGKRKVAEFLIDKGAVWEKRDISGRMAVDLAQDHGYEVVATAITEYIEDIEEYTESSNSVDYPNEYPEDYQHEYQD
jgi:ankyrin repeat protein